MYIAVGDKLKQSLDGKPDFYKEKKKITYATCIDIRKKPKQEKKKKLF